MISTVLTLKVTQRHIDKAAKMWRSGCFGRSSWCPIAQAARSQAKKSNKKFRIEALVGRLTYGGKTFNTDRAAMDFMAAFDKRFSGYSFSEENTTVPMPKPCTLTFTEMR